MSNGFRPISAMFAVRNSTNANGFTNANHAGMSKPAIVTSVSVCAPTTPLIWSVPAKTTTDIAVTMSGISYARFCATARSPPRSEYLLFDA